MKTACPPGYHYNDFVTTHALGSMLVRVNQMVLNKSGKEYNTSGQK